MAPFFTGLAPSTVRCNSTHFLPPKGWDHQRHGKGWVRRGRTSDTARAHLPCPLPFPPLHRLEIARRPRSWSGLVRTAPGAVVTPHRLEEVDSSPAAVGGPGASSPGVGDEWTKEDPHMQTYIENEDPLETGIGGERPLPEDPGVPGGGPQASASAPPQDGPRHGDSPGKRAASEPASASLTKLKEVPPSQDFETLRHPAYTAVDGAHVSSYSPPTPTLAPAIPPTTTKLFNIYANIFGGACLGRKAYGQVCATDLAPTGLPQPHSWRATFPSVVCTHSRDFQQNLCILVSV